MKEKRKRERGGRESIVYFLFPLFYFIILATHLWEKLKVQGTPPSSRSMHSAVLHAQVPPLPLSSPSSLLLSSTFILTSPLSLFPVTFLFNINHRQCIFSEDMEREQR